MRQIWQLQEAADNLSQVVDDVVQHGPQIITKDGVKSLCCSRMLNGKGS